MMDFYLLCLVRGVSVPLLRRVRGRHVSSGRIVTEISESGKHLAHL